jgi:hypothetical protein
VEEHDLFSPKNENRRNILTIHLLKVRKLPIHLLKVRKSLSFLQTRVKDSQEHYRLKRNER